MSAHPDHPDLPDLPEHAAAAVLRFEESRAHVATLCARFAELPSLGTEEAPAAPPLANPEEEPFGSFMRPGW